MSNNKTAKKRIILALFSSDSGSYNDSLCGSGKAKSIV